MRRPGVPLSLVLLVLAGCSGGYQEGELTTGTKPEVGMCTNFDPRPGTEDPDEVLLFECDAPAVRSRLTEDVDDVEDDCEGGGVTLTNYAPSRVYDEADYAFCVEPTG